MSPLCCTQLRRSCEGDNRHLPVQCHHTVACSWGLVKAIIDIYLFILASQKYTADTLWGWQDIYLSILTLQKYTVEVLRTSRNIHSHVTGSFSCCLIIIWSCFRGWEYGGNSSITMCVCVCVQGRQKLARFNAREFATLVMDILNDARLRQTGTMSPIQTPKEPGERTQQQLLVWNHLLSNCCWWKMTYWVTVDDEKSPTE